MRIPLNRRPPRWFAPWLSPGAIFVALCLQACTANQGAREIPGGKDYLVLESAQLFLHPIPEEHAGPQGEYNIVGTVLRGTTFNVTKREGAMSYGTYGHGARGWVQTWSLMPADGAMLATVTDEAARFVQPNGDARDGSIAPGTLLIVYGEEQEWSHVNIARGEEGWVRTDQLSVLPHDVGVSLLLDKLRYSKAHQGLLGPNYSFLDKAKERYPTSPLLGVIQGEADAPDDNALPTAATLNDPPRIQPPGLPTADPAQRP